MVSLEFRDPVTGDFATIEFGTSPVGAIAAWMGTTAPPGWAICDGTPHGSAELQAVSGSANTPDLRDRFIVGAGPSYAAKATGGTATETLTAAQSGVAAHSHTASSGTQTANHYHAFSHGAIGNHSHGSHYRSDRKTNTDWSETAGGDVILTTTSTSAINANYGGHTHSFSSGGISANHVHGVTVNNSTALNATTAHENLPPYYALAFIVCTG